MLSSFIFALLCCVSLQSSIENIENTIDSSAETLSLPNLNSLVLTTVYDKNFAFDDYMSALLIAKEAQEVQNGNSNGMVVIFGMQDGLNLPVINAQDFNLSKNNILFVRSFMEDSLVDKIARRLQKLKIGVEFLKEFCEEYHEYEHNTSVETCLNHIKSAIVDSKSETETEKEFDDDLAGKLLDFAETSSTLFLVHHMDMTKKVTLLLVLYHQLHKQMNATHEVKIPFQLNHFYNYGSNTGLQDKGMYFPEFDKLNFNWTRQEFRFLFGLKYPKYISLGSNGDFEKYYLCSRIKSFVLIGDDLSKIPSNCYSKLIISRTKKERIEIIGSGDGIVYFYNLFERKWHLRDFLMILKRSESLAVLKGDMMTTLGLIYEKLLLFQHHEGWFLDSLPSLLPDRSAIISHLGRNAINDMDALKLEAKLLKENIKLKYDIKIYLRECLQEEKMLLNDPLMCSKFSHYDDEESDGNGKENENPADESEKETIN